MGCSMRICELRQKEVINVRDCQRIGFVVDVEFDPKTGNICQLIIPGQGKWCGLLGRECVRQIGADIILVDVCMEEIMRHCEG